MDVTKFDCHTLSRFKQAYQSARECGADTFLFNGECWDHHRAVRALKNLERSEPSPQEVSKLRRKALVREERLLAEALRKKGSRPRLVVVSSFGTHGWGQVPQA